MRVLIAYDGSEPSNAAIDDLSRAGLPPDVEAQVLCVADVYPNLPPDFFEPSREDHQQLAPAVRKARELAAIALAEAKVDAARGAALVRAMFPGWAVEAQACGDVPYHGIIKSAATWQADLVVLGSQGRSGAGRAIFGSVAQKVLAHAPCSVRIARPRLTDHDPAAPLRLLIGMDNSVGAAIAIEAIVNRKWPANAEAVVAMALDLQTSSALAILFDDQRFAANQEPGQRPWVTGPIARVKRELEDAGLHAKSVVREDDPRHLLVTEAQALAVDCVFLGARGLSRLEKFLIGSVSSSVAARAHCTVEVVRQRGE